MRVLHQANLPSGGAETVFWVFDFLNVDMGSPQHAALLDFLSHTFKPSETVKHSLQTVDRPPANVLEREQAYEPDMQIIWDVLTREILVIFRGSVILAPQRFDSREEGIAWKEACRKSGWSGSPNQTA